MAKVASLFLVDDDIDDRQMFSEALEVVDSSVNISTAIDGVDAMNKLLQLSPAFPDVILLDLNMPRMNGKQFLQALKQKEELRHLPVVIYSTSSNVTDKEETSALGASEFIVKPQRFQDLCDSVKYILAKEWT